MFQIQLINHVVEWEWRLNMEEEKRSNLNGEPHQDVPVAPQSHQKEHKSISLPNLKHGKGGQPVYHNCSFEPCRETAAG